MKTFMALFCILIFAAGCSNNHECEFKNENVGLKSQIASLKSQNSSLQGRLDVVTEAKKANDDFLEEVGLTDIDLSDLSFKIEWAGVSSLKVNLENFRGISSDIDNLCYLFKNKDKVSKNLRQFLANSPQKCLEIFRKNKESIRQVKKHFNVPFIDSSIFEVNINPAHEVEFLKFFEIHTADNLGVWNHPKWDEFQTDFSEKFPDIYDKRQFQAVYKNWRRMHAMSPETKEMLITLVDEYNQL